LLASILVRNLAGRFHSISQSIPEPEDDFEWIRKNPQLALMLTELVSIGLHGVGSAAAHIARNSGWHAQTIDWAVRTSLLLAWRGLFLSRPKSEVRPKRQRLA
jgi:hypothetical protein